MEVAAVKLLAEFMVLSSKEDELMPEGIDFWTDHTERFLRDEEEGSVFFEFAEALIVVVFAFYLFFLL